MTIQRHSPQQAFVATALLVGALFSTGCSNLQNNLQDPAIWDRIAEISDRTQRSMANTRAMQRRGYAQPQRQVRKAQPQLNVAGNWYHSAKTTFGFGIISTHSKTNVITHTNGGIYAAGKGSNSRHFYQSVGNNTYRSQSGQTYTFTSSKTAIWRGKGAKTIKLSR